MHAVSMLGALSVAQTFTRLHVPGQAYSLNGIQSVASCGFMFVSRRLVPEFGRELLLDVPSKLPIVNISMRREFYFRLKLMHQN